MRNFAPWSGNDLRLGGLLRRGQAMVSVWKNEGLRLSRKIIPPSLPCSIAFLSSIPQESCVVFLRQFFEAARSTLALLA